MLDKISTPETKPFYLTSEFWVHALLQFLLWVEALPTAGLPTWGKTAISFAGVIGYGLSRGQAKSGSPFNPSAILSAILHDTQMPTALPQPGTSDIQPAFPPADGAGVKNVTPAPEQGDAPEAPVAAAPAVPTTDLNALLAQAREIASEHPEVITQLKSEGVIS